MPADPILNYKTDFYFTVNQGELAPDYYRLDFQRITSGVFNGYWKLVIYAKTPTRGPDFVPVAVEESTAVDPRISYARKALLRFLKGHYDGG